MTVSAMMGNSPSCSSHAARLRGRGDPAIRVHGAFDLQRVVGRQAAEPVDSRKHGGGPAGRTPWSSSPAERATGRQAMHGDAAYVRHIVSPLWRSAHAGGPGRMWTVVSV